MIHIAYAILSEQTEHRGQRIVASLFVFQAISILLFSLDAVVFRMILANFVKVLFPCLTKLISQTKSNGQPIFVTARNIYTTRYHPFDASLQFLTGPISIVIELSVTTFWRWIRFR